jgi:glycosyltransferase involved in cell wall biosynthesis
MNLGGPAIQISGLMRSLNSEVFEQILLTGICDQDEIDYLDESNLQLPVIRVPEFSRRARIIDDFVAFVKIRKVMRDFQPHIVHTHTAKAGFLGRLASISTFDNHIRVHTFHGHLLHGYFNKPLTKLVTLVEKVLAIRTQSLIAVGEQVKTQIIAAGIGTSQKFSVIGPGLELSTLPKRSDAARELGISPEGFTVVWAGRVVPIKAPHRIIEIAEKIRDINLPVRFLVAGDGTLLKDIIDRSRKLSLPIHFLGWQSEIEKVLAVSDVMILTSKNEGAPVALIQAQMAGIPVISTNVGSAAEVFSDQESGYLCHYSATTFAENIRKLLMNPVLFKSMSQNAIQNSRKFHLSRLVSDHENLYLRIMNRANV